MTTDNYEKIRVGFDRVKCAIHVADIHIRLTKRHTEYREALAKLYSGIRKSPLETVVLILGDTLHSKLDLSPEAVQLASEFLKNCADIRPTILVAGNHDCLLTNTQRLDSLTPIVENLNHPNLFYLKETKLYGVGNILFNNMSVFDDQTKYIDIKNVPKSIKNKYDTTIALFHGPVHKANTDIGYKINNRSMTADFFDGHDLVMLGDIHRMQDIYIEHDVNADEAQEIVASNEWSIVGSNDEDGTVQVRKNWPLIRYSGSVLQQNHGEAMLGHGYSIWNIEKRKYSHIEIPNDYAYYTIDVEDGILKTDISNMPAKPKLRVKCKETVATEIKKIITEIRKTREITDIVYVRVDSDDASKKLKNISTANINKISDVEYQNKLITNFLQEKYPDIEASTLDTIREVNKSLNEALKKEDNSRNIHWKPKRFEFSNMFSYGENNVLDFTKLNDVYGLFAANASGKSSLFSALCFCIFDKTDRTFKASQVMNSEKMTFSCKFNFEINGVDYFVERKGVRDKKGNVKVDVNFYKIENDKEIALNAEARRSTNEIIRDYLGTYDDFILTALALQGNGGSFIDLGQTQRKELLSQFIGLNLFDNLLSVASDRIKEISGAIKTFSKEDNTKKMAEMLNEIDLLATKNEEQQIILKEYKKKTDDLIAQTSLKNREMVTLDHNPTDINVLHKKKINIEENISELAEKINNLKKERNEDIEKLKEISDSLKQYVDIDFDKKIREHSSTTSEKNKVEKELEKLKTIVREKLKKLEHLEQHEYDENCTYCMNNVFVKDAISTKESLSADKIKIKELMETLADIKNKLAEFEPFLAMKEKRDVVKSSGLQLENAIAQKELNISRTTGELEKQKTNLSNVVKEIDFYEKSKEIIEKNKIIQSDIDKLSSELKNISYKSKNEEEQYLKDYSRRSSLSDQIGFIKQRIEEVEYFEAEYDAFQYYNQAIGSTGVPYQIISSIIPQIESEVNNILSQIVDFSLSIETDGKNVNAYINYEERKWPLDLCSGMEKFISSLALRVALINISNLPRSNMFVVDEGFSALDASNFPMVHSLFDFMKNRFDFIIVISHLDAMRDMVDKQLEITKENGFSKINNAA
jgi:DNA repair exonuclease SbcCD ATPase subunit